MDLTDTIIPKSDQLNSEDLLGGPRTVTITEVRKGASAEQPVDIVLAEFGPGRPFKPSKTVRRILVHAWGPDAAKYAGRRMTIYRDPDVKFGGLATGGIRISHLSHLDKPLSLALAVSKGKRAMYVVQPLKDEPVVRPKRYTLEELVKDAEGASNEEDLNGAARLAVRDLSGDDLETIKAIVLGRREDLKAAES